MKNRFIFVAICSVILGVSFASCGGNGDGTDTSAPDIIADVTALDSGRDLIFPDNGEPDRGVGDDLIDPPDTDSDVPGDVTADAPVPDADDASQPDADDDIAPVDAVDDAQSDGYEPLQTGPCVMTKRFDPECDGSPSTCEITEYNADGTISLKKNDPGCDGLPPFNGCAMYQWDESGRMTAYSQSDSCAETPDSGCTTYTYDEFDRVVTETLDEECSGSPNECYTYTYDPSGNLRTVTTDYGCAGEYTVCKRVTFDAKGNPLTEGNDENCDEVTADDGNCWSYDYLASGRISDAEWDMSCGGSPAYCYSYDYFSISGRGTVVVEEQNNCAGGARVCRNSIYKGGYQFLTESEVDQGCDGSPSADCKSYTYDTNGKVTMEMVDSNCDETLEYCLFKRWSGDGVLVLESRIPGCSQPAQDCTTYSYDGDCGSTVTPALTADIEIACGQGVAGNTAMVAEPRLSRYNCIGWTPTAKEQVVKYTAPTEGCDYKWKVTATMTSLSADLDLLLLSEPNPRTCTHKATTAGTADESLSWQAIPGADFYLVVEGYGNVTGTYDLTVTCECLTEPLPTCLDSCGGRSPDGSCSCDATCVWLDDCCVDRCEKCPDICAAADCGGIDNKGVCDGNTAKYCQSGVLMTKACGDQTCDIVGYGVQLPIGPCSFLPADMCDESTIVYAAYRADCVDATD